MPPIRVIFFDIGDTLVFDDPPIRERFRQATHCIGLDYPSERLTGAFRVGEEYAITRYLHGESFDAPDVLRETAARILSALGVAPLSDGCWQALARAFGSVPWERTLHPQALGLIAALRAKGFRVGAISDWEATLPDLLAELALAPHLEALAVSAVVGCTKPDARLFREALQQMDVPAGSALHVGDWYELDVAGARSVGMTPILFDHACRRPDADSLRVESFDQLTTLLLSLPCPAP